MFKEQPEEEYANFIIELELSHPGKAGQGLEVGAKTEPIGECHLLTFSS